MSLTSWLLTEHPFFDDLRQHLLAVIDTRNVTDLDDLVIASRRPVRTVILGLNELIRSGEVRVTTGGIVSGTEPSSRISVRRWGATCDNSNTELVNRYLELAADRETPSLLWGQRRLIPRSAIDRARYILSWLKHQTDRITFLGDDDLVSPIVAALAPSATVQVIDIDSAVLQAAQKTALELGAAVNVEHSDLSRASLEDASKSDIVVSDPFPSADGSFESVFWNYAAYILRVGGVSITTVAPSHKPIGFDGSAVQQQRALGLCVIDLQADFGVYESFDFEFTAFEKAIFSRNGLRSTVGQTKSISTAQKVEDREVEWDTIASLDFDKWTVAATNHYLTIQAGVNEQVRLAAERGLQPTLIKNLPTHGLRTELIVPSTLRQRIPRNSDVSREEKVSAWSSVLEEMKVAASSEELNELINLAAIGKIQSDGPLSSLGLAIRAIESWERKRLDAS
jgi:predicted methyltransferase